MKKILLAFSIFILLGLATTIYLFIYPGTIFSDTAIFSPMYSEAKYKSIQVGMSSNQVLEILLGLAIRVGNWQLGSDHDRCLNI